MTDLLEGDKLTKPQKALWIFSENHSVETEWSNKANASCMSREQIVRADMKDECGDDELRMKERHAATEAVVCFGVGDAESYAGRDSGKIRSVIDSSHFLSEAPDRFRHRSFNSGVPIPGRAARGCGVSPIPHPEWRTFKESFGLIRTTAALNLDPNLESARRILARIRSPQGRE